MTDDLEQGVRAAYRDLGPSPTLESELLGALESAPREKPARPWLPLAMGAATACALAAAYFGLVRSPNGTSDTGIVVVPGAPSDGRTVRVVLSHQGEATLLAPDGAVRVTAHLGDEKAAAVSLDGLAKDLAAVAATFPRAPDGTSTLAVEVASDAGARWQWVQWILMTAADPRVRVRDVRFTTEDPRSEPIAQTLPADRSPSRPEGEGPRRIVAQVLAVEGAGPDVVRVRLRDLGRTWDVGVLDPRLGITIDRLVEELRDAIRRARAESGTGAVGEIAAPFPLGAEVPYAVVFAVLRAFREAGVEDVQFEGTALPDSGFRRR